MRQMERVLSDAELGYGFLVTGERFRLMRASGDGPRGSYLEVDLAGMAEDEDFQSFALFHRLFHAQQFLPAPDGSLPISSIEAASREHAERVSEDLKRAVFTAAESLVGGLLQGAVSRGEVTDPLLISEQDLHSYRDAALTALYRILFILYAEARDRRLQQHRIYEVGYSVHGLIDELMRSATKRAPENRSGLWARLKATFRIYDEGLHRVTQWEHIPPRGGDFFKPTTPQGRILDAAQLPDRLVARVLLDLTTAAPRRGIGRERVSFRELDIESLGAVYEGLLEYEPRLAREVMLEVQVQGKVFVLSGPDLVRLCQDKGLRVKGDFAIVSGTAAECLHPDAPSDEDAPEAETEDVEAQVEADEESGDEDDANDGVAEGATVRLTRRFEAGVFHFVPGSGRKGSGTFYTPLPLVQDLVRHTLGPLAIGKSVHEIESLRIVDPACGSAHFLVEAMRFLGKELHRAYVRECDGRPPLQFRGAWDRDWQASDEQARASNSEARAWCKRRIAERCLYGIDLNPTAVALARVALWIESLAGDRPLTYFEHHIRCGNSLLGTWLDRLDQPPLPSMSRSSNVLQVDMFGDLVRKAVGEAARARRLIDEADQGALNQEGIDPESAQEQEFKGRQQRRAEDILAGARLLFDLRSASAFLPEIWEDWPSLSPLVAEAAALEARARSRPWWDAFRSVCARERFFHWELEFPERFLEAERTGFDAVLGNPPWDKVLPSRLEFYSRHDVLIRAYKGNELDRRIRELHKTTPGLKDVFAAYQNRTTTLAHLLRRSGDFPLSQARSQSAHEDLSKYFVDRTARVAGKGGRVGLVVPSVIYNGDGCVGIRRFLLNEASIERFYGFENRKKLFPIDSRYKFVNLVFRKGMGESSFHAAFMRHDPRELLEEGPKPWMVRITRDEIRHLSPETLAFLEFRSPRDQEIVHQMYRGRPRLGDSVPGGWEATFISWRAHSCIYNSSEDKDLWTDPNTNQLYSPTMVLGSQSFSEDTCAQLMRERGFWPIFEGKHIDQCLVGIKAIRWWLSTAQAEQKYGKKPPACEAVVFRETASNTNERTCIAVVLPSQSAASHKLSGLVSGSVATDAIVAVLNSFCFDYALRARTAGTNVSFTYMKPMAVPPASVANALPTVPTRLAWRHGVEHITEVRETWQAIWASNRAVAEAYGLTPDDFEHVLDFFPVFARKRAGFYSYLQERLAECRTEFGSVRQLDNIYSIAPPPATVARAAESPEPYELEVRQEKPKVRQASTQFKQAAIFAWVVQNLYEPPRPVSRFRVGKTIYLIEQATSPTLFNDFSKQAAGPYDPKLRYRGPESIAVRQMRWLVAADSSHFAPGPRIDDVARYVSRYVDLRAARRVVEEFRDFGDDALERWTTVDMAARETASLGGTVDCPSVLAYIEASPQWKGKLDRQAFAPELVESALRGLRKLGFLP